MSTRIVLASFAVSALIALCLSALPIGCGAAGGKGGYGHPNRSQPQYVVLDGRRTQVFWNDGDSFRVTEGPHKELRARLVGYNTLESYGPVHFWGAFHGYDLYDNAKGGTELARQREWECHIRGSVDGYGRALVHCPVLRRELIREGLAHIFHFGEGAPDPDLVAVQLESQRERRGMWKWGIPEFIVTSIHSMAEDPSKPETYNRICSTRTGLTQVVEHTATFETCSAWCHGGSCMVYAPFEDRYTFGSDRVGCLRNEPPNVMVPAPHLGAPASRYAARRAQERRPLEVPHRVEADAGGDERPITTVTLDGRETQVRWDDGDSFTVVDGPYAEASARLADFNTLESYGPVHFWGGFTGADLHENAAEATAAARAGTWTCEKLDRSGGYGRLLVRCDDLTRELLSRGLAHVFHVGKGEPDPALIDVQLDAQEARLGMWARGIPARIVTSLHSAGEDRDGAPYNRVCDTRTGRSWVRKHEATFEPCDAWCDGGSCMVYVPYEQRYEGPSPYCMETGDTNRLTVPEWRSSPLGPGEGTRAP